MEDPHAAPGRLEQLRSFINTADLDKGIEPRTGADELASWCAQSTLSCASVPAEGLQPLREFREALRDIAFANAGQGDLASSWAALEPFAAQTSFKIRITQAGVPRLSPQGEGVEGTIAVLMAIVYDAVAAGTWPRLKACREENCRFAFYDNSKNASGAWCSMAVCGNRNKAKRRRARAKSGGFGVLDTPR